ncbi:ankyrin repeat-containing protein [Fusarium beomiforme]|uniref:Ankyrin repeat-containing protein n=1 Tax=Fusarium beomiforme TaxID=44412 RepID=A0A9P5E086_9HYPO|nr:ankyrin repeat-containing protein [Fusarium beomiforme]
MQKANDKAPSQNDPVFQHCQMKCDQVVRDLEALNKKLVTGSKRSAKGKVFIILTFRHWKENVEDLRRDIGEAKLNLILQTCDKESCNVVKYGGTVRLALSQLGIRWAAVIQLYIVTTSGKYSLRPSFDVERIVPYTSPGFEILWKMRNLEISFEEGREELVNLHRTDPTFPDHVDPSGHSYIECLLMTPARWPVEREWIAEMSPLHEAVLFQSPDSVRKWVARSRKDERNAFGQTSLHLAISTPQYLRMLIEAGYQLNARDNYGITPLMYAAAINQEEAVIALIEAGSDLNAEDKWNRNFMFYAGLRQHWHLVLKILNIIENQGDFEALLANGFTIVNHVDSDGQLPVMEAAGRCDSALVSRLLAYGTDINHKDKFHNTSLCYVLRRLHAASTTVDHILLRAMETLRVLLENNANVLTRDTCRCPCSPQGCLPAAGLQHETYPDIGRTCVPVWSLEWLSLVLEHRGESEAKTNLLSFIRRAKHAEMGMTHVCCRREQGHLRQIVRGKPIPDEDIDEIIDEESEFIEDLEREMDQSSRKGYNALLDDWIVQIKTSLNKVCIEAAEQREDYNVERCHSQNREWITSVILSSIRWSHAGGEIP